MYVNFGLSSNTLSAVCKISTVYNYCVITNKSTSQQSKTDGTETCLEERPGAPEALSVPPNTVSDFFVNWKSIFKDGMTNDIWM